MQNFAAGCWSKTVFLWAIFDECWMDGRNCDKIFARRPLQWNKGRETPDKRRGFGCCLVKNIAAIIPMAATKLAEDGVHAVCVRRCSANGKETTWSCTKRYAERPCCGAGKILPAALIDGADGIEFKKAVPGKCPAQPFRLWNKKIILMQRFLQGKIFFGAGFARADWLNNGDHEYGD